jgi:hypothetical protein
MMKNIKLNQRIPFEMAVQSTVGHSWSDVTKSWHVTRTKKWGSRKSTANKRWRCIHGNSPKTANWTRTGDLPTKRLFGAATSFTMS